MRSRQRVALLTAALIAVSALAFGGATWSPSIAVVVGKPATSTAAASAPVAVPRAARYHVGAATRQVIVVTTRSWHSTQGWLRAYSRTPTGWHRWLTVRAYLGYAGLVVASHRMQSTGTTPAGKFAITESFGRLSNPGTVMPYVRVGSDHWWVEDRRSAYYNQLRLGSQGGFARTTSGADGSEHLTALGPQYDYVAVIDFNRPDPVLGRGSGIFLHISKGRPTIGCVSVPRSAMRAIMRWLRPSRYPRIVIGPQKWLQHSR